MKTSLTRIFKALLSTAPREHQISGTLTNRELYGFHGQTVSATKNAKLTGLNQRGLLLGLQVEDGERLIAFIPDHLENGAKNPAKDSLIANAISWGIGPNDVDTVQITLTGTEKLKTLPHNLDGATRFFIVNKDFSVAPRLRPACDPTPAPHF